MKGYFKDLVKPSSTIGCRIGFVWCSSRGMNDCCFLRSLPPLTARNQFETQVWDVKEFFPRIFVLLHVSNFQTHPGVLELICLQF